MTREPYSYRSDPAVPAFDDAAPLIIFDGHCVLCTRGHRWMLRRDPWGSSRFAAIQHPLARALYHHYGLDADRFDTFMVLAEGVPYTRWAGVLAAGRTLPPPWKWLSHLGRLVPAALGNALYDWVQRNRIAWFGRRSECPIASPGQLHRLLT